MNNHLLKKKSHFEPVRLFFKSSTTIAIYLLVITILSVVLFFLLFPKSDNNTPNENLAIISSNIKETILNVDSISVHIEKSNNGSDSLLIITAKRDSLKSYLSKDTLVVAAYSHLPFPKNKLPNQDVFWLIILIGALGASIHGLNSVSRFTGNDTFNDNWALWYWIRPVLGAALAFISYCFLRAGLFTIETTKDLYGVIAVAGLIGLFSKQALSKISDIADAIFTSNRDNELGDKLFENQKMKKPSVIKTFVDEHNRGVVYAVGKNFSESTSIHHKEQDKEKELPRIIRDSNLIEIHLNTEIQLLKQLHLIFRNSISEGGEIEKTVELKS